MSFWWFLIPIAYLMGSSPTANIVGYLVGHNPTQEGSKNPGATNVFRLAGYKAGVIVLLSDIFKGVIPVVVATIFASKTIAALCLLASVVGHIFPVFTRFKGGKGVATFGGATIALNPIVGLSALFAWICIFAMTRLSSLAGLLALPALVISTFLLGRPALEVWISAGLSVLITIRHKENILRLITGKEAPPTKDEG